LVKTLACRPYCTNESRMNAVVLESYGKPKDTWKWTQVTAPTPLHLNPNNVLVHIKAASLNTLDLWMSHGYGHLFFKTQHATPPLVLGRDASGIIEAVGSRVWDYKVGDHVMFAVSPLHRQGTLTEFGEIDQWSLAPKPTNLTFQEAASLPFTGLTAWSALVKYASITKGQTVLVHGAAGNVGTFAIQYLSKVMDCHVVATCKASDFEKVSSYGAHHMVDCNSPIDMSQLVPCSFDVVLDTTPVDSHEQVEKFSIPLIKKGGHFVTLNGDLLRAVDSHGLLMGTAKGGASLLTKTMSYWISHNIHYHWGLVDATNGSALSMISSFVQQGKIRPRPINVFKLTEFQQAIDFIVEQKTSVKVVLSMEDN